MYIPDLTELWGSCSAPHLTVRWSPGGERVCLAGEMLWPWSTPATFTIPRGFSNSCWGISTISGEKNYILFFFKNKIELKTETGTHLSLQLPKRSPKRVKGLLQTLKGKENSRGHNSSIISGATKQMDDGYDSGWEGPIQSLQWGSQLCPTCPQRIRNWWNWVSLEKGTLGANNKRVPLK